MNARLFVRALLAGCIVASTGCFSTLRAPPAATDDVRARLAAARTSPTGPARRFDDSDWRTVLERHVDDAGRVDYAALRADRAPLDRFVARLAASGPVTTPELFATSDDRLAYALNAYNALVIFSVLQHPGLVSVNDSKLDFFYLTCFELDGAETNLYDLENDGVRARFHEPAVHMALNCASRSCPELPREPFTGPELRAQLAARTTRFLHDPRHVAVEDGVLVLSEVFDWFAEDFVPDAPRWIAAQAPDLALPVDAPVRYRPWDWSLNSRAGLEP